MNRYVKCALFILLLIPACVKGAECKNADKVKYQNLAKNIKYTYEYVETEEQSSFNLTFNNIDSAFKIYSDLDYNYQSPSNGTITYTGLAQGISYKFYVYTDQDNCSGVRIYSLYVTLPYFNSYYNSPLCEGIEEFKYCKKWTRELSEFEEFEKEVEKYKKSLEKKNENKKVDSEDGLFDVIIKYSIKYWYVLLPIITIITLGVVGIVILNRRKHDLF